MNKNIDQTISSVYSYTEYSGSEDETEAGTFIRKREYEDFCKPTTIPISFLLQAILEPDIPSTFDQVEIKINNIEEELPVQQLDKNNNKENGKNNSSVKKQALENEFSFRKSQNFKYFIPFITAQRCECKEPIFEIVSPESIFYELKKLIPNKSVGDTILHIACRRNIQIVCSYLVHSQEFKDNLDVKENAGYTPLHEACLAKSIDCARIMLRHGANPNCALPDGTRPIHDAIDVDDLELIKTLISFGADPTLKTYGGKASLDFAKSESVQTFLERYIKIYDVYQHDKHTLDSDTIKAIESLIPSRVCKTQNANSSALYEIADEPFPPTFNVNLQGQRFNIVEFKEGDPFLTNASDAAGAENYAIPIAKSGTKRYILYETYAKIPNKSSEFIEIQTPAFDVS